VRRLIVCREYPPAPGGGIGTYTLHAARAFAEAGESVHVIGERWPGSEGARTESMGGRLIVHRLPVEAPGLFGSRPHRRVPSGPACDLFQSGGPAAAFAWQVAGLAEQLVASESIDVIEAPEYEAPLLVFQLRRSLGLGPDRRPPCLIHLHSSTELIATANGMNPGVASRLPVARLERESIRAADALVCPSGFLARQVTEQLGLASDSITVIPYPLGETREIGRPKSVWSAGSILYLGRLELRKGIVEWLEAAVALARQDSSLRFEFVGSDHIDAQLGGSGGMARRVPATLRGRFRFHDHRSRAELGELLARARLVVVPSRWENFPYTCIEAMASGVAVVASPDGGMREMIEHGVTGWIAASQVPADLARATRDALAAGPDGLAAAGARAAIAIRRLCDERQIVKRQWEIVDRMLHAEPRSSSVPGSVTSTPKDARDADQEVMRRFTAAGAQWSEASAGLGRRVTALRNSLRRGAAQPVRTAGRIVRHVRWRLLGTPP
jgi:glycosyltransferase involved in cell wall biosynthesis